MCEGVSGIRATSLAAGRAARAGGASCGSSGRAAGVGSQTAATTTAAVMLPHSPCRQGAAIGVLIHGDMEFIC